jgi:hypothetical protein
MRSGLSVSDSELLGSVGSFSPVCSSLEWCHMLGLISYWCALVNSHPTSGRLSALEYPSCAQHSL